MEYLKVYDIYEKIDSKIKIFFETFYDKIETLY